MSIVKHETGGNGNVFHDLNVEDAENLRIRALLMFEIEQYIQENDLTQDKAAEVMQTTQPYISDIVNGRLERFTIDRLVTMLAAAGRSVTVTVDHAA